MELRNDLTSLSRNAQQLVVETRHGSGSPPVYESVWQPLFGAKVDRIEINLANKPSVATIWFPELRWQETLSGLVWGDMVRIRTDEPDATNWTVLFSGFLTSFLSDFCGGTAEKGTGFERTAIVCMDYRWLLGATSFVYGQIVRGPDDYTDYGTTAQLPIDDAAIFASGRRAIFNFDGKPNRAPTDLVLTDKCSMPIFANPKVAQYWTAREMMRYVLSPLYNLAYDYLPIKDPALLPGLTHKDWDNTLNSICVEGLSVLDAAAVICKHLGWSFREDFYNNGVAMITFFKAGSATGYVRSDTNFTIRHWLHAPAVGELINTAVAEGAKILWAMNLAEDISPVINQPVGLGIPDRFEVTVNLVPAWADTELVPDTSESNANLYFIESDLSKMDNPNDYTYYKYYHPRGSEFRRHVGRRWALNESGTYSNIYDASYDRGLPFDFSTIIGLAEYVKDDKGKRLFAPYNRQFLPCLTIEKDSLNSVGFKVEFSFDKGVTWQVITGEIEPLRDECGIYIIPNLAELVDQSLGTITDAGSPLNGEELNYWTSICDDKLMNRKWFNTANNPPTCDWKTRVRVTATIQMDQRLHRHQAPSVASGSPFHHSQLYDFSEKYGLQKRTESSVFRDTTLIAYESADRISDWFDSHLKTVRDANEGMSVSGQFTLERLWLGDGAGFPDFCLGDCIEKITGRNYDLCAAIIRGGTVFPEIIQIIYLPDKQMMKLITRDLRYAEVHL